MTKEQIAVLSLISTVVSGAHDVRLTADICWAKVMEEAARQGCKDFVLTLWSCCLLSKGLTSDGMAWAGGGYGTAL